MITYSIDSRLKCKPEDIFYKLPKFVIVNAFSETSAKTFREDFDEAINAAQPVVPVLIDSFGGAVYSLLSMMDTISSSPVPVATYITGKAMSCGALLFSCGTEGMRFISPMATVLIHDVSYATMGKVEEIKADASEVDRLNQIVYKQLARNCGQPETYFLDLVHARGHADWYLTPEDCLKHKLANRIGMLDMKVNVSVKIDVD